MKTLLYTLIVGSIFSCSKAEKIKFSEIDITVSELVSVVIHIPKAEGKTQVAITINTTLQTFICKALDVDDVAPNSSEISLCIFNFEKSYKKFSSAISATLQGDLPKWEAILEGEVTYNTPQLISIAMYSSINTGAVHARTTETYFNFDVLTGKKLKKQDIVTNVSAFTSVVKKYFNKEVQLAFGESPTTLNFKLPENFGFTKKGLLFYFPKTLENTFKETALQFTIPYELVENYINY